MKTFLSVTAIVAILFICVYCTLDTAGDMPYEIHNQEYQQGGVSR